jgi:GDP-L-fucose synthase
MDWGRQRVLLTGASGFLRRRLSREQPELLLTPTSGELDLRQPQAVRSYLTRHRPSLVIHAAGVVGGIGANRRHPGRFFYENAAIGIRLIEEARLAGVAKLVCVGTVYAYPRLTPVPFREDDLWNGYPEETNAIRAARGFRNDRYCHVSVLGDTTILGRLASWLAREWVLK